MRYKDLKRKGFDEFASLDEMATERQIIAGRKLGMNLTEATFKGAGVALGIAKRDKILVEKGLSIGDKIDYRDGKRTGTIERGIGGFNVRIRWDQSITREDQRPMFVSYVSPRTLMSL